ncbi:hypothetical protein Tco_1114517 [Tanacetum coccineum]|uniref:Uncharacterized protein n=1 Tax=Tanacetum coccineum TaxID=301880 RepID=A0ABQ5IVB4_9ASTR
MKHSTSSKQPSVSSKEATTGGSSKAPTSSKTGHSKKRKESSSAMDSNPSQPPVSTPIDTGMHKEDQQVTGGPTSLGVTSEARANPQLSSGMSAFNLNEPIYLASFIIHSESSSGDDALVVSTTEVNPGKSAPSDFVPQQQGMNEGTKNTSYDQLFASTDPHVLADKTQSVSEGLETVLTQPTIGKGASSIARQPSFEDLDSPEDDHIIVVDDNDEDEEADKVAKNDKCPNNYQNHTPSPTHLYQSSQPLYHMQLLSIVYLNASLYMWGRTSRKGKENRLEAKAEAAKQEGKVEKAELVDLLGAEVVNKYYNDKLQYDRYCDKMLNRRAESRITNCDVLTKKGPITLKVYREDGTSEVIPNFKALVNEEK